MYTEQRTVSTRRYVLYSDGVLTLIFVLFHVCMTRSRPLHNIRVWCVCKYERVRRHNCIVQCCYYIMIMKNGFRTFLSAKFERETSLAQRARLSLMT